MSNQQSESATSSSTFRSFSSQRCQSGYFRWRGDLQMQVSSVLKNLKMSNLMLCQVAAFCVTDEFFAVVHLLSAVTKT